MSVNKKMTAIASAIREKTGSTQKLGLDDMAAGVEQVFETGKQTREDAFWDDFQENGARTNYNRGFCGRGWKDATFKPKYDIRPVGVSSAYTLFTQSSISDLKGILEAHGVLLDLSQVTGDMGNLFANCFSLKTVPSLDLSGADSISYIFAFDTVLEYIEKITVSERCVFSGAFINCYKLNHVIFDGTIGQNGLDMSACKALDKESIESIIHALSGTTTGLSITLSTNAVTAAFGSTTATEWTTLIGTRSNWTISLV